jgi:hypothetical protein
MRLSRLISAGLALTAAGSLALVGCSATKDAATNVGDAAKDAATATGQAALAPAVTPVLDLLRQSKGEVQAGNLGAAVTAMGGFKSVWDKAAPVIRPLAGDKWPMIDTAAKLVLNTFDSGSTPDSGTALSAITGLIGPLSSLIGQ